MYSSQAIRRTATGRLLALAALTALLTGCAGTAMKGTPFYTGEYEKREGPAEERLNAWPLFYYRDPALSVLWPFFELSDEHLAVRPAFSVEHLDEQKHVYNVLWPISQVDMQQDRHRVFPLFWWGKTGDAKYRVVFPLYWHTGEPFRNQDPVGLDALFPAWIYDREGKHFDLSCPWPLVRLKRWHDGSGWRVWPLVGATWSADGYRRFALWPLIHQWKSNREERYGDCVVPFYYRRQAGGSSQFLSIPWSHGTKANGDLWQLLPPVFYRRRAGKDWTFISLLCAAGAGKDGREPWHALIPFYYYKQTEDGSGLFTLLGDTRRSGDERTWFLLPVMGYGKHNPKGGVGSLLFALIRWAWGKDALSHHLLPFYHYARDDRSRRFLSLPWSCGTDPEGSWQLVPPLFHHRAGPDGDRLITPVWAHGGSKADGSDWHAVIPLYYYRTAGDERFLVTLLGGGRSDHAGRRWLVLPLLSVGAWQAKSGDLWFLTPLVHAKWDPTGSQHHALPFYYWNGWTRTFLSPVAARWRNAAGAETTLAAPALSWLTTAAARRDLWLTGGMAHFSWGEARGSEHVVPLYYRDPRAGTFVSAPWARWRRGDKTTSLVPPLASWLTAADGRRDLWLLGPMAHWSWGKRPGSKHVLPVFYRNPRTDSLVSPLLATWKKGGRRNWLCPPLLSGYARDANHRELIGPLGVFFHEWGGPEYPTAGHLFPAYFYRRDRHFYTPLFGWNNKPRGFVYPMTPLVGVRKGDHSGFWTWPLCSYKRDKKTGRREGSFLLWGSYEKHGIRSESYYFPLYGYENGGPVDTELPEGVDYAEHGKRFVCLPGCWYVNRSDVTREDGKVTRRYTERNGVFPLWSYFRRENPAAGRRRVRGRLLLLLYDYKRTVKPDDDYTRARILWRLWHYERSNGDVSVDAFPAITYDRKTDGFKKMSFLVRFFRYERSAKGGTKLDLLFIPILRTAG